MPVVKVEWFEGRRKEIKAKVAEAIEKIMVEYTGCPAGVTYIIFEDVKKENWVINGKLQG